MLADVVISSPPYAEVETGRPTGKGKHLVERKKKALRDAGYSEEYIKGMFTPGRTRSSNLGEKEHYGSSEGQLGGMQPGEPPTGANMKKTKKGKQIEADQWENCYESSWKGLICDDAFVHPAKAAHGLLTRILKHLKEEGWIKKNDLVVDCFGGVGTTGLLCAYQGIRCVSCELEPRFVDLAKRNYKMHARTWRNNGLPEPVILQGDSRRLAEIIAAADCIVSSPPFSPPGNQPVKRKGSTQAVRKDYAEGESPDNTYGDSPGQLAKMGMGGVDAVISSPPYSEEIKGRHAEKETAEESQRKRKTQGGSLGKSCRHGGYGTTEGNISNLPAGKVDGIVSSPPFEKSDSRGASKMKEDYFVRKDGTPFGEGKSIRATLDHQDNLGNSEGATFWEAARDIVLQCHKILKSGGESVPDGDGIDFCECD